jgi:hypothetical protein
MRVGESGEIFFALPSHVHHPKHMRAEIIASTIVALKQLNWASVGLEVRFILV